MDTEQFLRRFWSHVAAQDAQALTAYFHADALIFWHCTNECFSTTEYVRANCEYPGHWGGEVERVDLLPHGAVTVARVWDMDSQAAFHAVSFFRLEGDRITALDEYWGDDGPPPHWRKALGLGRAIRK